MARGGVTYLDVVKVAEKLKNKGIIPTIDKIRVVLGTGSKTTLAHHLKRWKSSTVKDVEYHSLPTVFIKSVKELYEELKSHAEQKTTELSKRAQQEIERLLQELKQERENAGALKRNILTFETNNNKATQQISALEKSLLELNKNNAELVAEKSELSAIVQEKAAQILTLKEQLKSVEHNGEHYREMLKQQRDEEKKQLLHQITLLQQENNTYKTESIATNTLTLTLKQENIELQSKAKYFENLYTNKVAENELISNKLLTATARQETLINDLIKNGSVANNTIKKKKVKQAGNQ